MSVRLHLGFTNVCKFVLHLFYFQAAEKWAFSWDSLRQQEVPHNHLLGVVALCIGQIKIVLEILEWEKDDFGHNPFISSPSAL